MNSNKSCILILISFNLLYSINVIKRTKNNLTKYFESDMMIPQEGGRLW